MLVPENIVKQWYKESHPIYKSFAFIFQNPLWQTRMPAGFSVCPYFWMSVLSFVLLRPFVYLVHYVLLPLLSLLGRPGKWVNKQALRVMDFLFPTHRLNEIGAGGFVAILLAFVMLFLGLVLYAVAFVQYHRVVLPSSSYVPWVFFWSLLSLIPITIGVSYYRFRTKNDSLACKVHAWYLVWLPVTLLALLFLAPGECWHVVLATFSGLWWVISGLAWLIWQALYYAVAYGLFYAVWGLGWFAWHLVIWIWNILTYPLGYGIPWWIWVFGIPAGFGYAVKKLFDLMPKRWFETKIIPVPDAGPDIDPAMRRRLMVAAWLRHIRHIADASKLEQYLKVRLNDYSYTTFNGESKLGPQIIEKLSNYHALRPYPGTYLLIDIIHDHMSETYWKPLIEKLVDAGIEVPTGPLYWSMINKGESANQRMRDLVAKIKEQNPALVESVYEIGQTVAQLERGFDGPWEVAMRKFTHSEEFEKEFLHIDKDVVERQRIEEEKLIRRQNSPTRQWCRRTTGRLLELAEVSIDGLVAFGIFAWKLFTAPFRGLWWLLRQIGILIVYFGMVIKAKKKGACPYIPFEKNQPFQSPPTTESPAPSTT